MDNSQNRIDIEINPVTGQVELVNDLEMGWSVRNISKAPFSVKSGYTRMYPNLQVPDGMIINIEDDGELIAP